MKYVLGAVLLLHILSKLFTHWFVNLKSRAQYIIVPVDKASHIKVGAHLDSLSAAIFGRY